MDTLSPVDLLVLVAFFGATVGLGCRFAIRGTDTDGFMAAGRSLPGWAVGLSMFGSYISSISFLANPGKSFADNWNGFVFSLATPIAALVAIAWFVPFYRRTGQVSAYAHLEERFGPWARTYAVACFLLTQMARNGTILYLLALAVEPMLGWKVPVIIVLTGTIMIMYTAFGGIRAAVWIGVVQSLVLLAGALTCLVAVIGHVPGGLAGVVRVASGAGKFGLGGFGPALDEPTFWVVLVYGLTINLGNFSVDQSYVQRFVTTPTDREARLGVLMTAALYVPVAALFFFIGTALYAAYTTEPGLFPAALDASGAPDRVFPYFIRHMLPSGIGGLVVASIFAASMDSTLSSMATLSLCDLYTRYARPRAGEQESLRVLHLSVVGWGVASMGVALAMVRVRNALDVWWEMAGIFSGGMLGLFLLGVLSRARNAAAGGAVALGIATILWMTVSRWDAWPASLARLASPFHAFMIPVVGTLAILVAGIAFQGRRRAAPRPASGRSAPEARSS